MSHLGEITSPQAGSIDLKKCCFVRITDKERSSRYCAKQLAIASGSALGPILKLRTRLFSWGEECQLAKAFSRREIKLICAERIQAHILAAPSVVWPCEDTCTHAKVVLGCSDVRSFVVWVLVGGINWFERRGKPASRTGIDVWLID